MSFVCVTVCHVKHYWRSLDSAETDIDFSRVFLLILNYCLYNIYMLWIFRNLGLAYYFALLCIWRETQRTTSINVHQCSRHNRAHRPFIQHLHDFLAVVKVALKRWGNCTSLSRDQSEPSWPFFPHPSLSLLVLPFLLSPSLSPLPSHPSPLLPLRSRLPLIQLGGLEECCKLSQRVRTELGRQAIFGAFLAENWLSLRAVH